MVALRSQDVDRFLTNAPKNIAVWLVFGPDDGLVDERIGEIVKASVDDPADPFQVARLAADQLSADPALLLDEWNAISLFNTRRVLRLDIGGRDLSDIVRPCLDAPNPDCALIVKAGALRRDAALRQMCERHKLAVAIECFADSERDLHRVVADALAARKVAIDEEALDHLIRSLGADRRQTRNELDKLATYVGEGGVARLEDVEAIVSDAAPRVSDVAIAAAMRGNLAAATLESARYLADEHDHAGLVSSILRAALLAHRAGAEIDAGQPKAVAIERATRMAGGLRRFMPEIVEKQRAGSALASIEMVRDAVSRVRRNPALGDIVAMRTLWSIARRAQRR